MLDSCDNIYLFIYLAIIFLETNDALWIDFELKQMIHELMSQVAVNLLLLCHNEGFGAFPQHNKFSPSGF